MPTCTTTHVADGRTYAGGLTKFKPRGMEHLFVPSIEMLEQGQRSLVAVQRQALPLSREVVPR